MASFVARRAAFNFRISYAGCSRRTLHATPIVLKKKAAAVEIEDLFSDNAVEDLISPVSVVQNKASSGVTEAAAKLTPEASSSNASSVVEAKEKKPRRLSNQERLERFNNIISFVTPRLGRKQILKMPMVRNAAWHNLVQLAKTEQQLKTLVELFPGWIEAGRKFNGSFSELFVRRCEELHCPLLALEVYGNFAKYNVPLTLPGARQLLHSLHQKHSIEAVLTAASLYDVYSLPSVSEDLVSASLVASACFQHNTEHSLSIAGVLVPQIKHMLTRKQPEPKDGAEKLSPPLPLPGAFSEKPSNWLKWTLKRIDKAIHAQTGKRDGTLFRWRLMNEQITSPTSF
ncbi:hypothetical protein C0992_001090 [Termitomyces sp. T32_za158]|nr:hypothetical protein C0992_001090 [Termitomyces sp. T32_za158]